MPRPRSILETVLYSRDLPAMLAFYRDTVGLSLVRDWGDLGLVFRVTEGAVLLVFNPDESSQPGRSVPSHGVLGVGHAAFRIDDADYHPWLKHLAARGVPVEHEHEWREEHGWRVGRSIYVRDPAGNSVEFLTADIWPDA